MDPETSIPPTSTKEGTAETSDFAAYKQQREAADARAPEVEESTDAQAETASDAVPDEDTPQESDETTPDSLEDPKTGKPRKLSAVEQLKRLRRRSQDAEKRSQEAEERVQRLERLLESQKQIVPQEAAKTEEKPERPKRPKFEEFPSIDEWTKADEKWLQESMGWEFKQYEAARTAREQQQREQSERDRIVQHWNQVSARAETEHPGFKASIEALERKGYITPPIASTIVLLSQQDEAGAIKLARALINDQKTAQKLSQMPHYQVPLELGRILHSLSSANPPKSEVPANHKPALAATTVLNGSGPASYKLEDAKDFSSYARLRDKQESQRRRR